MTNEPTVREVLEGIYYERGRLTPVDVVEVARDADHPLHGRFTWDDGEAADKWREAEASHLIRTTKVSVQIVQDGKPRMVSVRAFPSITGEDYMPLDIVMERPDYESALLEEMKADIRELKRKYDIHAALFSKALREAVA